MIRITNTQVFGFEAALRGMRNPMESWDRSDTQFLTTAVPTELPNIGPADLKLMRNLIRSGSEHRKFLRSIVIWARIEAPRYVWQEIDTYKVSTVRNSCSTMHKLGHRPLTEADFQDGVVMPEVLAELNRLGEEYRQGKDYALVIQMKRILPEGFLQLADYNMNYETALTMWRQRHNHRLPEWRFTGETGDDGRISICDWIHRLPYMRTIILAAHGPKEAPEK